MEEQLSRTNLQEWPVDEGGAMRAWAAKAYSYIHPLVLNNTHDIDLVFSFYLLSHPLSRGKTYLVISASGFLDAFFLIHSC